MSMAMHGSGIRLVCLLFSVCVLEAQVNEPLSTTLSIFLLRRLRKSCLLFCTSMTSISYSVEYIGENQKQCQAIIRIKTHQQSSLTELQTSDTLSYSQVRRIGVCKILQYLN